MWRRFPRWVGAGGAAAYAYYHLGGGDEFGRGWCQGLHRHFSTHLKEITEQWKKSPGDTWPWVWVLRTKESRLHCFVGSSSLLMETIRETARQHPHDSLFFIGEKEDVVHMGDIEELDDLGVAVVEGPIERLDTRHCILVTKDDRCMEFDRLTVMCKWPLSAAATPTFPHARPGGANLSRQITMSRHTRRLVRRKSIHAPGEGLYGVVESWKGCPDDTHPWVWIWRVPMATSHLFVGPPRHTLDVVKAEVARSTEQNFIAILPDSRNEEEEERMFNQLNCAVLHGEIAELDGEHAILMMDDDRVLEFDVLTICYGEDEVEASAPPHSKP